MTRRRGDNIPSVADYAHWNEDAQYMWYAENRYDMEHADEIIEDDDDRRYDREDDPYQAVFYSEAEARAFIAKYEIDENRDTLSQWWDKDRREEWIVEHYSEKGQQAHLKGHA